MHFQNTLYIQSFNNIHMTFTCNMDRFNIFPYILISLRQLIVITSDFIYSWFSYIWPVITKLTTGMNLLAMKHLKLICCMMWYLKKISKAQNPRWPPKWWTRIILTAAKCSKLLFDTVTHISEWYWLTYVKVRLLLWLNHLKRRHFMGAIFKWWPSWIL